MCDSMDVEVMELPYVFRTTLATMPRQVPYFSVPPAALEGDGLRVGVAWRAGKWDERRTIPFELLRPLLAIPGVSWCRLQRDAPAGECDPQLRPVDTSTIVNTAGAIRDLDLVLSIDSMPAHLAGALGARVWTLLPFDADWRWLEGRDDSPWYPTMRTFRQSSAGDWRAVVDQVRDGIVRLV